MANKEWELDVEQWLKNRLGEGNAFEQFNRGFCEDLAHAAQKKALEHLKSKMELEQCDTSTMPYFNDYYWIDKIEMDNLLAGFGIEGQR